jgi:hypothetical protein
VDKDAADVVRVGEAEVLPGLSAVERLVDVVPPRRRLPVVRLARAHVQDLRVGGGDREVADREDELSFSARQKWTTSARLE